MSEKSSTILANAVATFTKVAHSAFRGLEDELRDEVARAVSDAQEAHREREAALEALHTSQLEQAAWKQEARTWKAAIDQAELTIAHQAENIAQLQQEATQWKDQCLRLQETARQEALDWKEQFIRVDQERTRLIARLDESMGDHQGTTPYTPQNYTAGPSAKHASTSLHRSAQRHGNLPSPVDYDSPSHKTAPQSLKTPRVAHSLVNRPPKPATVPRRRTVGAPDAISAPNVDPTSTAHKSQPGPPLERGQQLIRRVNAVIEVEVKHEDDGSENSEPSFDASASGSRSTQATSTREQGDAARSGSEEDGHPDDEDYYEEGSGAEDEDDELMMGAEDDHAEVYGTQTPARKPRSTNTTTAKPAGTSGKKRKPRRSAGRQNPAKGRRI
ncbi:hypothetical protein PLICRDRAFT_697104 [Plicaturopsis crispa FD-325 SS-3]|nr:hypothetical protein PLICRDRAFT_697104 [Plicaturopsis crispa FD-325 SS-3]